MAAYLILLLIVSVAAAVAIRLVLKHRRRAALLRTRLTEAQRAIVATEVPLTRKLPARFHQALEGKINAFIGQVDFVGCNGLEVSEEMRLSIAAQACLLIVNSDTWYDHLTTILIYPAAFKSRQRQHNGYVVTERETVRSGESWSRGPVILSWADTRRGALNDRDGHNVVFHEFAHQIDDLSGHTDGLPNLPKGQSVAGWARTFVPAYQTHVQNVQAGHRTVFDAYGATGPEEFFAVAVETFFEKPAALNHHEPAVYRQLAQLFRLDPLSWG
ncbi:M90 family metallopeptidase [Pseudodonghicola flavimaris]|uniref:Zinc-dependent peptidase n=1 Tax=Pseudodonghicola flavimaris TaxID=3050036 RepID=A0ABT7F4I5_9RHOB|nr:M90 family metallopeptidase [Pseudodonghicola flavimaris]MDK3019506.1 zinc-dependent peptidase [Pseudodonghicola flavimaris]